MGKKKAPYVLYAMHHRKKYEKRAHKPLSVPELVTYASEDWKKESEEVKDYFKAISKGESSVQNYPVHETSCQRLETEAPVVTDMSIGEQWNQKMRNQVKKASERFKTWTSLATIDDIMDRKIGVIDFNVYVEYLDGLSVPAEFAIARGTVRDGITEKSVYSEIIHIDPQNESHLRRGFLNEVQVNCERVHGIDVYSNSGLTFDEFCREVGGQIPPHTLLLCRAEDERHVMGSWYWLKQKRVPLPKIELITIEDFLVTTTKFLNEMGRVGPNEVSGASFRQFTGLLSKPTYDTETSLRCEYHNGEAACDKPSCTKKNTRKYFFLLAGWLAEFLPELNLENGKHYYQSPSIQRRGKQPPAVPSTSRAEPHAVEWDYPEREDTAPHTAPHTAPRRPAEVVYSARGECSKASKPTSNRSSPLTFLHTEPEATASVSPQLPRRPKTDPSKPVAKASNSYDKGDYTYDGWNGAKARGVDPKPVPQTGAPTNNSIRSSHQLGLGGFGRGRSRRGSSSPPCSSSPPGYQTAHPGYQAAHPGYQTAHPGYQTAPVPPGYTSLPLPITSDAKSNGASFGRGQRFAAAQVTQVTEIRAPFVSDVESAERELNGMDFRE